MVATVPVDQQYFMWCGELDLVKFGGACKECRNVFKWKNFIKIVFFRFINPKNRKRKGENKFARLSIQSDVNN